MSEGASTTGEPLPIVPLRAWLTEAVPSIGTLKEVEQYPGGFSNLTYLLKGTKGRAVLRRPPHGVEGGGPAHDMLREASILDVLDLRGVPAPRVLAPCADASVIGSNFYVMTEVPGVILRGAAVPPAYTPQVLGALGDKFIETLAAIHGATPADPMIAQLGKPMGYVSRQVEGWATRWTKSATDPVPAMDEVAQWLADHQPSESGACLIHNDFKFDNLVLDPVQPARIVAVLDWEMATCGDPLLDVGTMLGYWVEANDPPIFRALGLGATALPGNLTRAELWSRYLHLTGRTVADPTFYRVFGLFKIAVIAQQIFARYRRGLTTDARFARLGEAVTALSQLAVQARG